MSELSLNPYELAANAFARRQGNTLLARLMAPSWQVTELVDEMQAEMARLRDAGRVKDE